jgi:hypothetical protein
VVAVVEADADQRARAAGGIGHGVEFRRAAGSRLFDQDVLSGGRRFRRDRRQLIVRGGDEHRVDIVASHRRPPIGGRRGATRRSGQLPGALRSRVAANRHAPGRK